MIFHLTAKKLISYGAETSSENLRESFVAFIQGLISFPLDIPGTAYHKCLKGRKQAMRVLKRLLQERRERPRKVEVNFFDYVLEELQREDTVLTEGIALDLMFVLLFASFETTSLSLTLATKLLSEHPLVLKQMREEHDAIIRQRGNADSGLTWADYKSMKFTFQKHRNNFITVEDFNFLYRHGINTVRIPVGWWIAYDPIPPPPFIGGSLQALDNAFSWALEYNIKCIIDLHAAPGSQNGMEHSSSRDGTTGWPTSSDYISQTLNVIDFIASRYAKHPSLLGIELLNEPSAASVPLETLASYYKQGYKIVRKYSSTAYVIFCQRIGNADPLELYQAKLGDANTVIDLHYYNLFDTFFVNMSSIDNIQYIYKSRETQLQALNGANGPLVFIGEWVNEWNVNGSQTDYQDFGQAQLEVYNAASFGWAYWTLKNDRKHWDFEWNVRNNYLQLQLGCSSCRRSWSYAMFLGLACSFYFIYGA